MNGLLIVNKEKDLTSRDVVNYVSKILNTKKIGHTGTLDPMATGVLVLAIGNALKVVDLITSEKKEYVAIMKLGLSTDTLDITGNVLEEKKYSLPSIEEINKVLNSFIGKSIQEVPLYSAVKVNGKRLYEYARSGIKVELPKREIEIFDIEFLEVQEDTIKFRVVVSKGTYIRSLIRDIGVKLNIPSCMSDLCRTKQGVYRIEDSYSLKDIEEGNYKLLNIKDYLNDYEKVEVDDFLKEKIINGRILENRYSKNKIAFIYNNEVIALYEIYNKDNSKIKPMKVLNNKM